MSRKSASLRSARVSHAACSPMWDVMTIIRIPPAKYGFKALKATEAPRITLATGWSVLPSCTLGSGIALASSTRPLMVGYRAMAREAQSQASSMSSRSNCSTLKRLVSLVTILLASSHMAKYWSLPWTKSSTSVFGQLNMDFAIMIEVLRQTPATTAIVLKQGVGGGGDGSLSTSMVSDTERECFDRDRSPELPELGTRLCNCNGWRALEPRSSRRPGYGAKPAA
mmetsp:Transcript_10996/g.28411  ORF Transcript_10996/g.28411 Transcript_10996/m.28411 type:complete len:225 (-) Transcript_10996:67-741(-)